MTRTPGMSFFGEIDTEEEWVYGMYNHHANFQVRLALVPSYGITGSSSAPGHSHSRLYSRALGFVFTLNLIFALALVLTLATAGQLPHRQSTRLDLRPCPTRRTERSQPCCSRAEWAVQCEHSSCLFSLLRQVARLPQSPETPIYSFSACGWLSDPSRVIT